MRVLKGIGLGLLVFLLAVSLIGFGLAMMLNSTVLNPDFLVSQINKTDTAYLAQQFLNSTGSNQFPPEIKDSLVNTITKSDAQIKRQVSAAVYPVYAYLRGETNDIDLADTLSKSLLQRDFVVSLVNDINISALIKDLADKQLNNPSVPMPGNKPLSDYINNAITGAEPQLKQQINAALGPVLDYLLGKSQSFKVQISLSAIVDNAKANLRQDFLKSPPTQFAALPPAALLQAFDAFYNEITKGIPTSIEIDQSSLGAGLRTQIADALASARQMLTETKQYVGYALLAFRLLPVLILLCIAGIILINRQVKASTRRIGIIFITYGALEYLGIIVAKLLLVPQLTNALPSQLQTIVPQMAGDVASPLQIFSLAVLAAGIVLLVISFVYKPHPAIQ